MSLSVKKALPRVLLLIDTSRGWGRRLLYGISEYVQLHGMWSFYREPPYFAQPADKLTKRIHEWKPDGIIMREMPNMKSICEMNVPTIVDPYTARELTDFANIVNDNKAIGEMAAECLLELGLSNFAYCGFTGPYWSYERGREFKKRISQDGYQTNIYQPLDPKRQLSWSQESKLLADWLTSLPKPTGLMACSDERSVQVVEACKMAKLRVPDDIAIIGVDNDDIYCKLSSPPLSSISLNAETVGYKAAELLAELMNGEIMTGKTITISPANLIQRESTHIFDIDDQIVSDALIFIRDNIRTYINAEDVVKHSSLSRRGLEKRFKSIRGKTIYDEIRQLKAKSLAKALIETDLPVAHIGLALGYPDIDHISRSFRTVMGMTPMEYRRKYKNSALQ